MPIEKTRTDSLSLRRREPTEATRAPSVELHESNPTRENQFVEKTRTIADESAREHTSSSAGAKNAVKGMGMFGGLGRSLKRGLVVALIGLSFATGPMSKASVPLMEPVGRPPIARVVERPLEAWSPVIGGPPPENLPQQQVVPHSTVVFHEQGFSVLAPQQRVPGRDSALSVIDETGAAREFAQQHLLPSSLWNGGSVNVEHGTDPGDYYCEHALFTQQRFAAEVGIVKNAHGEPLVGFLHVPDDALSGPPAEAQIDLAARYAGHREVVGAAFKGYFQDAKDQVKSGPVRILVTGYGPFMGITNNPSGGFVSSRDNIDAAMKSAFGSALLSSAQVGTRAGGEAADSASYLYRVKEGAGVREILIVAERLDVDDKEFVQESPTSLIGAMRSVRPHAMLSLGVHGGRTFLAEHHADDGGLLIEANGNLKHEGSRSPTMSFLDNYALARAIYRNAPPAPVPRV